MQSENPMSRELMGKIVDEVFDGAIEDASVIEEIYAAIKRHEAALSKDAEPVAFTNAAQLKKLSDPSRWHEATICPVGDGAYDIPLYADPVKTAPAVAVKAIEAVWKYSLVIESSVRRGDGPDQYAGVTEALRLVKDARSALSAQVQDVVIPEGWQLVPIKPTKGMAYAAACAHYGKKRVDQTGIEGISMTVNNIDYNFATAFRRFWKGALAASPASKHGDAE